MQLTETEMKGIEGAKWTASLMDKPFDPNQEADKISKKFEDTGATVTRIGPKPLGNGFFDGVEERIIK